MTRTMLFPVLLVSGLAFAADPTPTPPATGPAATPTTPTTPPAIPKAVFKDVDKNGDKVLDRAELADLQDLLRDYDKVDTDKNGKLSEAEYDAWIAKPSVPLAVFKDVDKNGDKALDKAELANIADLLRDFNTVDTDKNGKLSEAEYNAWLSKQNQM